MIKNLPNEIIDELMNTKLDDSFDLINRILQDFEIDLITLFKIIETRL